MNRRDLFKFLGASAASLIVPELWLPRQTFFLPPVGGWAKYDSVSIALGYTVTREDIADNLYNIRNLLLPGMYKIFDEYETDWASVFDNSSKMSVR